MAKGKKKRKGGPAEKNVFWNALAAEALGKLGNAVGKVVADGAEYVVASRVKVHGGGDGSNGTSSAQASSTSQSQGDVGLTILRTLNERGDQSIPDLVSACGCGLTQTLQTLHVAREFGLIEYDEQGGTARLSDAGRRLIGALCPDESHESQVQQEESSEGHAEAFPE